MNLKALVAQLRSDADELEALDKALSGLGKGSAVTAGKKKTMSAKARAAISRAQKLRWSKVRAAKK